MSDVCELHAGEGKFDANSATSNAGQVAGVLYYHRTASSTRKGKHFWSTQFMFLPCVFASANSPSRPLFLFSFFSSLDLWRCTFNSIGLHVILVACQRVAIRVMRNAAPRFAPTPYNTFHVEIIVTKPNNHLNFSKSLRQILMFSDSDVII